MGIDARSGLIVALVPGGTAEEDGLMAVGDTIMAVDGVALAGQRLGNLLPSESGASCELTLTRTDETFAQQLQCLGLPPHSTYALLRFQVRRSVADGLGVAMQAALVREVTAATSAVSVAEAETSYPCGKAVENTTDRTKMGEGIRSSRGGFVQTAVS